MNSENTIGRPQKAAQRKYEHVTEDVVSSNKQSILSNYRADDFDSVLLITSASRGGSSLLFDILRHHE
jgi:hypothetical protein